MKIIQILLISSHIVVGQVIHTINFDRFTHYEKDDWITYGYSNSISSIDIGVNYIYFATRGGGILQYDIFGREWLTPLTTSNGLSSNYISKILYKRSHDELYALTKKGVDVYNETFEYWQSVPESDFPAQEASTSIAGHDELPPYSRPSLEKWPTFFPEKNYTLMLDGTLYNPDNEEYKFGDRIVDNWDRMWIATNGVGIAKADLQTRDMHFIKQSIPAIYPKDVFVSGDDIWIGGDPYILSERGITHWDYESNIWTYYKSGFDFNIFSDKVRVIEKSGRNIFFGTEQGLLMYDVSEKEWRSLQNAFPLQNDGINDLYPYKGILYVATDNGVYSYNSKSGIIQQISEKYIHQTAVHSLTQLQSHLYIATNYGIFKYDPNANTTEIVKSKAAIADNFIDAVAAGKNTLWFSGRNGIGYYNIKKDEWRSFPGLRFSLKSAVNHIALTRGNVWFATNDGLLKYDIKRDYWYLYTTKDGLADNRVSRIETDGDYLWLATHSGVTFFCWNRSGRLE